MDKAESLKKAQLTIRIKWKEEYKEYWRSVYTFIFLGTICVGWRLEIEVT